MHQWSIALDMKENTDSELEMIEEAPCSLHSYSSSSTSPISVRALTSALLCPLVAHVLWSLMVFEYNVVGWKLCRFLPFQATW